MILSTAVVAIGLQSQGDDGEMSPSKYINRPQKGSKQIPFIGGGQRFVDLPPPVVEGEEAVDPGGGGIEGDDKGEEGDGVNGKEAEGGKLGEREDGDKLEGNHEGMKKELVEVKEQLEQVLEENKNLRDKQEVIDLKLAIGEEKHLKLEEAFEKHQKVEVEQPEEVLPAKFEEKAQVDKVEVEEKAPVDNVPKFEIEEKAPVDNAPKFVEEKAPAELGDNLLKTEGDQPIVNLEAREAGEHHQALDDGDHQVLDGAYLVDQQAEEKWRGDQEDQLLKKEEELEPLFQAPAGDQQLQLPGGENRESLVQADSKHTVETVEQVEEDFGARDDQPAVIQANLEPVRSHSDVQEERHKARDLKHVRTR